ncbi:MAG: T9SS type A sorting domain-containing protein, partial [Calditrichaeota bacterium]|nr:T9SS type A sorting domain-containing protein [Calditrichota bacterium]
PNPFNPTTNISFSLPQATDVSIRIFDLQGRLIREYNVAGNSAGMYKIQWDGKNNHARNVGSGFYFYQLSSENTTLVRKMLLIK